MSQEQAIEYTIYTTEAPAKKGDKPPAPQKNLETQDMPKALQTADSLLESGKYIKVEVKKKFFDSKNNRTVDMTLKVLEGSGPRRGIPAGVLVTVFTLIGSVAAFALTYYLSQGAE